MPRYVYAIGIPAMLKGFRREVLDYIRQYSMAQLARCAGVHRNTLRRWLSGKQSLTIKSLLAVARALAKEEPNSR